MYTEDLVALAVVSLFVLPILIRIIALPQFVTIREDKRLVIFRHGLFNRIAGPGRIMYWRRFESVESEYHIRDQPYQYKVQAFVTNIPVGYSLDLWFKLDPQEAAGNDKYVLRTSALYSQKERLRYIEKRVTDTFNRVLMDNLSRYPSVPNASLLLRLLPYVPGHPHMLRVLNEVRCELGRELKAYGAVLNFSEPLQITGFDLSAKVIEIMNRGLEWKELQQQIPNDMTPDEWARLVNVMNGAHKTSHQRYTIDSPAPLANVGQRVIEGIVLAKEMRAESNEVGHRDYARDGTVLEIA